MSEIPQLGDGNVGAEIINDDNNNLGDELDGKSAFTKALEVFILRNIQPLLIQISEPLVRRVVKEEFELAQHRYSISTNLNSEEREISSPARNLKLRFRSKLSLPILTGKPILDENNFPLLIDLIDENTGLVVKFGPEASGRIEIVVLRVDSHDESGQEWTSEEFFQNIVIENGKSKARLVGKTFLNLKEGTCAVDKLYFTHGSSWTRKSEFMLGAHFVNNYDGITVSEAKSERFILEDSRSKLYGKHYPPDLFDEVWRLEKIRKGGKIHKRLEAEKIKFVREFLIWYYRDSQKLQKIVQMPDKVFAATVKHGLTCKRGKHIYHPPCSWLNPGVIFDDVGELLGVICDNGFVSVENLSEKAKDDARTSIAYAFENWSKVLPYDNNSLPNLPLYSTHSIADSYTHPSTSSLSSADIVHESHLKYTNDEMQPIITPSSMGDMDPLCALQPAEIEFLREILKYPVQVPEPDYVVEDLSSAKEEERLRNKKWIKMVLAVRFLLRMRSEKAEHARKRMRFQ